MISRIGYVLWIALALACGSALAQEIRWAPDVPTARRAAMEYKVPVLIHFYGDNCLPCKLLEQNVLSKPEIVETLNKYFICVRVNGSQDRQTAAQYGVHSWPTDVFLGPDGKPLDQGVCKQNPGEYLSVLHNMAVLNRDRNVLLAAQQTESAKQVPAQLANYSAANSSPTTPGAQFPNSQTSASHMPALPIPPAQALAGPGAAGLGTLPVPPQLNVLGGPLPGPGATQAGNPNGPNFYAQGQGAGLQQLPVSLPPNSSVTSGPMLNQNQPQAITTPVAAAASQIAGGATTHNLQNHQGQLPAMQLNAQIPPASHPASVHRSQSLVIGAPTVTEPIATSATNSARSNTRSSAPRISASPAQMLENPHFVSAPPLPATGAVPNSALLPNPAAASVASNTPAVTATQPAMSAAVTAPPLPALPLPNTPNMPNSSIALYATAQAGVAPSDFPAANAVAAPRIPASTISFQPRNALSIEANRQATAAHIPAAAPPSVTATNSPTTEVAPAMDGYCPMSLRKEGAWVKGQAQFAVKHRGRIYHFTTPAHQQEFLQRPDSYSPVLAGYDPMVFLNTGRLVEGSLQLGLTEETSGQIMFFSTPESKQAYEQNYDRNAQALQIVLRKAGIEQ